MARAGRLPPMHALAAFEAAARLGGFGPAAAELSITPSAVSHRIRQLESVLGEPLFERTPAGIRLNAAGQQYLDEVRKAFDQLARLGRRSAPARLRVGVPPTFARNLLIPALPDFYRRCPEIEIEVDIDAPLAGRPTRHDVDVRWGGGGFDERPALKLFDDEIVALASPDLVHAHALEVPADLERVALLRSRLLPWRPWFAAAGLDWPEPARGAQFADLGILLEAAAGGLGAAACTRRIATPWLRTGRLRTLFDIAEPSPQTYWLLVDAELARRPEVSAFCDWLAATLAAPARA